MNSTYWTADLTESIEDLARVEVEETGYLEAPEVDPWAGDADEAAVAAAEAEYDATVNR